MAQKNTVLLIEPRIIDIIPTLIDEYYKHLGDTWNYVFYCGKNTKSYWESLLRKNVEIRELDIDNFSQAKLYNDFLKQKSLWESLSGEFILTIQTDTWIVSSPPYTIDYFLNLKKSFIGGNMCYNWNEHIREDICFQYRNFNGGLSLRRREDMILVIDSFPPKPTSDDYRTSQCIETDAEDCYFVTGCHLLGLPIGNDEESSHFAVHYIYKDTFFGIHNPKKDVVINLVKNHPDLCGKNPLLHIDLPSMKIFYRYTDSNNNKNRPSYFSKEKCLQSFLKKFIGHEIYIVADNVSEKTYTLLCEKVGNNNVIRTSLYNSKGFLFTVKVAIEKFSDDEKIYLVEDDYIHTKNAANIIMEGLGISDYVSGYDHFDKYVNRSDGGPNPFISDGGEETRVILSKSSHWKLTNSCCMTFATTVRILKEDYSIYEEFCQYNIPSDFQMFIKLRQKGRKLISCIPAVSTHCEPEWLSPLIDWGKTLDE